MKRTSNKTRKVGNMLACNRKALFSFARYLNLLEIGIGCPSDTSSSTYI
jgi:hypothetical protein